VTFKKLKTHQHLWIFKCGFLKALLFKTLFLHQTEENEAVFKFTGDHP
jgi:hypothetical protein